MPTFPLSSYAHGYDLNTGCFEFCADRWRKPAQIQIVFPIWIAHCQKLIETGQRNQNAENLT